MRRRERYGTYGKSFEDELDMVPLEKGITHLYNARGIVDKWLGHPTLDSIFPGFTFYCLLSSFSVVQNDLCLEAVETPARKTVGVQIYCVTLHICTQVPTVCHAEFFQLICVQHGFVYLNLWHFYGVLVSIGTSYVFLCSIFVHLITLWSFEVLVSIGMSYVFLYWIGATILATWSPSTDPSIKISPSFFCGN